MRENIQEFINLIEQITRETVFNQQISELVFRVTIFDLNLGNQIDSVKHSI